MAPIITELQRRSIPFSLVHTGQHYDYDMSLRFIHDLHLPKPDHTFRLGNRNPASQMGEIMTKLERVLRRQEGKLLCIQGDTNSMLAAALTGIKLKLRVCHVEAGLRSYDWRMPEEHNRRMVDHVSDILFAPTKTSERNLKEEHVHGKVYVTGNTVIDAVNQYMPVAERESKIADLIEFNEFVLATLHRAENVDQEDLLRTFVDVFVNSPIPVVFPIHPRTSRKLKEGKMLTKLKRSRNVQVLRPLGYLDFLMAMRKSRIILTDSGGIQEEATAPRLRKPVLVLRLSTERPEVIQKGFGKIVGVNKENILKALNETLNERHRFPERSPLGDGRAAQRIVSILSRET